MSELKTIDREYIANTYARFPVELVRGKGSLVYDAEGREYIDMGSGIGVTAFGIADDAWKAAVTAQLEKLQHMSNLYYTEPCAMLAKLLCEKTGMKKVFFCNSGAEANEGAIKAARKYAAEKKGPEYFTIVTLVNTRRHRPGPLSRALPAADPGLRPRPGQRPGGRQGGRAAEQGRRRDDRVCPGRGRRDPDGKGLCDRPRGLLPGAGHPPAGG